MKKVGDNLSMKKNLIINFRVLAADGKNYLLYKQGALYFSEEDCKKIKRICTIPLSENKKILSKSRIMTRLLRLEPRTACIIGDCQFLVSCSGKIFFVDARESIVKEEFVFRKGMNNPLKFVKIDNVEGFVSGVYFGEYFSNNDCESVNIYRRDKGIWNKVYSFAPGTVYHIHGIVADVSRSCIYILTGDSNQESAIWEARDNFNSVTPILIGRQRYRSCVAFSCNGGILYATDTSREQNYLCFASEERGVWKSKVVTKLPGPCIYGTKIDDTYYFATSVEPDDTIGEKKFLYTYKLGKGVQDRWSYVMKYRVGEPIEQVFKFKKDIWPMLLFQFGNCFFPDLRKTKKLVLTPISVKKYDAKTIIVRE